MQLIHRPSGQAANILHLGPYQLEPLLTQPETQATSAYRVKLPPGQISAVGFHQVAEEFYFILAGDGSAVLDGKNHPLAAGDFLRLPPGTRHGFTAGPNGLDMLNFHTPGCFPGHDTYFVGEALR